MDSIDIGNLDLNLGSVFEQKETLAKVDDIFSYFIKTKEDMRAPDKVQRCKTKLAYMTWFAIQFPKTEFTRENKLFWHIVGYASSIGVNITEDLIKVYCQTDLKEFVLKEKLHTTGSDKLKFDDVSQVDTIVRIASDNLLDEFYRLSAIEHDDLDSFIIDIKLWMTMNKSKRLETILSTGFEMMDNLKKNKVGTDDSLDYVMTAGNELKMIYDEDALEDLADTESFSDEHIKFVTDSGIPGIDGDSGGLYETQMLGLEAGEGEGKSRFSRGTYAYRAATIYKQNVLDFMLEQDKSEVEAMYIARHIYQLREVLITDKMILTHKDLNGDPLSEEMLQIIEVARFDLFRSGNYGKIHIVADMLYLETFIERIKMLDMAKGPFKLILIDYLTLIEQENTDKYHVLQEHQVYKKAYKWFKRYLRKYRKAGIAINQLKAEESNNVSSGKSAGKSAGSGSSESRKTPDRVDVLSSTDLMKRKQMRKITPVKARSSEGARSVLMKVLMGQCYFEQAIQEEEFKE